MRRWAATLVCCGLAAVMIAGTELVVMANSTNELVVAEASSTAYNELHRHATGLSGNCYTVPVLANGRLYCRNHPGDLVCLDLRGK